MVVVRVYYHGCDVRASVATVYVTFIEWGQGGVGHSGAHQLNLRPTLVTLRVPLAHAITKHHQHLFSLLFANKDGSEGVLQHLLSQRGLV